jgi:hypothetical protein
LFSWQQALGFDNSQGNNTPERSLLQTEKWLDIRTIGKNQFSGPCI